MAKDFLLEIGVEPLPARFVEPALQDLLARVEAGLKESRLGYSAVRALGTLRRLAVVCQGVEDKSRPLLQEVQGPPARLLRDAQGSFTPQAEGFARKYGLSPAELRIVSTPKGEFLQASVTIPGESAAAILSRVAAAAVAALEFPKSMEWEESRFRFGRPIRSLLVLHGSRVLPLQVAGAKSGRRVDGLAGQGKRPQPITEPGRYQAVLKSLLVIADPRERREALEKGLEACARKLGGRLEADEELVAETVFMTEHPVPVAGSFRKEFLALPAPLIVLVLKKQLKFFPIREGGALTPYFIAVRDGVSEGQKLVREGYERVLEARLSDAAFFIARDRQAGLEGRLGLLSRVTYQKGLGSMADKAVRVGKVSAWLCETLRQDQALEEADVALISRLCYADLVCEVVKEFPELQGIMGGIYARSEGLAERVALGIEEFYLPLGPRSNVPATREGALASLAGKIDTLAGSFAAGAVPTGSADPLALRRQALGSIRILLEKQFPVDLEKAFEFALSLQPMPMAAARSKELGAQFRDFTWARAQSFLEEMGYKADEIRSVRAEGLKNFPRTLKRLSAVHGVRQDPEFEALSGAFKRVSNILRQARIPGENPPQLDRAQLREEAELALYDRLAQIEGQVREKLSRDSFDGGLKALAALKPDLDEFFEHVMVMAEDPGLKTARLGLLGRIARLFNSVADLSEIGLVGPDGR
ncbi:MAG: glycine--tRNA ligase subunit beta [Elusimicrobia bacterium]|nr:glycine--tRNA ligase subunit beta [Elusimicrobiota bacterium]